MCDLSEHSFVETLIEQQHKYVRRATTPGGAAVSTSRIFTSLRVGDNFETRPIRALESGSDFVVLLNSPFRLDSIPGGTIMDPLRRGLAESRPETTLRSLARSSGVRV